jgi:hypothetical protein
VQFAPTAFDLTFSSVIAKLDLSMKAVDCRRADELAVDASPGSARIDWPYNIKNSDI